MPSVLFAYKPPLDYAERADDVRVLQAASTLDSAQLATSHPDAEALITLNTHRIDSQVLTCRPVLRVVTNVAAGIDNIDVEATSRLGILICNVPGAVEETTADLTFGLIISACRQLTAAEQQLRTGRWTRWELNANLGMDVHDANLGLVGFGTIGQAVVRRASGFGMTLRHHTRRPTGRPGWTASLLELLENADIVSVHVPLTADTIGLIGPRELSVMQPSADNPAPAHRISHPGDTAADGDPGIRSSACSGARGGPERGCQRGKLAAAMNHCASARKARPEEMPPVGPRLASLNVRGRCQATRRPARFASSTSAPPSSRSGCHELRGSADQIKVQVGPSSGQPPPRIQSQAGDPLPKARPQQGDAPTVVARARTRKVACRLGSLSGSWSAPGRLTRRRPA